MCVILQGCGSSESSSTPPPTNSSVSDIYCDSGCAYTCNHAQEHCCSESNDANTCYCCATGYQCPTAGSNMCTRSSTTAQSAGLPEETSVSIFQKTDSLPSNKSVSDIACDSGCDYTCQHAGEQCCSESNNASMCFCCASGYQCPVAGSDMCTLSTDNAKSTGLPEEKSFSAVEKNEPMPSASDISCDYDCGYTCQHVGEHCCSESNDANTCFCCDAGYQCPVAGSNMCTPSSSMAKSTGLPAGKNVSVFFKTGTQSAFHDAIA